MSKINNTLITTLLVVAFLYLSESIVTPLMIALLTWFCINLIREALEKIPMFHKTPFWFKNIVASLLMVGTVFVIIDNILSNIQRLYQNATIYQNNIQEQLIAITETIHPVVTEYGRSFISNINIDPIISGIIGTTTNTVTLLLIVFFYALFLVAEQSHFQNKIYQSFPNAKTLLTANAIIHEINQTIRTYFVLKVIIGFLTATIAYVMMWFINLDFIFLWAFLIFILNFIPNIGSILATLFPVLFSLAQFSDPKISFILLMSISTAQIIVGNIIEPKLLGNSLNLSPLVLLIALIFWGTVWGGIGLFLAVPMMVVLLIVLTHIPYTRNIAIWLSQTGNIKELNSEKFKP